MGWGFLFPNQSLMPLCDTQKPQKSILPWRSLTKWTPPLSRYRRSPFQSRHGVTTGASRRTQVFSNQAPEFFRIFLMTAGSSMKAKMRIRP
jgi:hypothetical protein